MFVAALNVLCTNTALLTLTLYISWLQGNRQVFKGRRHPMLHVLLESELYRIETVLLFFLNTPPPPIKMHLQISVDLHLLTGC